MKRYAGVPKKKRSFAEAARDALSEAARKCRQPVPPGWLEEFPRVVAILADTETFGPSSRASIAADGHSLLDSRAKEALSQFLQTFDYRATLQILMALAMRTAEEPTLSELQQIALQAGLKPKDAKNEGVCNWLRAIAGGLRAQASRRSKVGRRGARAGDSTRLCAELARLLQWGPELGS